MGQCYVRLKAGVKRRLGMGGDRQYRHKRYDYTPKRSWRYNDDHVLNQITLRGTEYDSPVWELEERGEGGRSGSGEGGEHRERVLLNPMIDDDSEEEGDLGDTQSGGRLVFAEVEESEDIPLTPTQENTSRHRSASTSSQIIGRFEVCEVPGSGGEEEGEGESGEGEVAEVDVSEMDTTQLLNNELT